ncbi:hypothetical protein RND81_04G170800 [Saponaria officinalis]|uniref:Glutaredoxin domain-containing protein n=1 Tax=Saponaria officinalis TaxID=3572 RepID=A0AAW1LNW0_SAPOF
MGCVSSKNVKRQVLSEKIDLGNHVVSLTSSTYGALKLDRDPVVSSKIDEVEVINTWELMSDLEDEAPVSRSCKKIRGKENRVGPMSKPCNSSTRRRMILGPLVKEEERIKKTGSVLDEYELKCPPGGDHCVVMYSTTLRGIRKTFEDCNAVRSVMESYQVRFIERDISMDCGFKEELRKLMGTKEVKVPAVFVKGRLIGGANEVVKLEEEGKLERLLEGIPKVDVLGCQGCGGVRFVMCVKCNGSRKVLDQSRNSSNNNINNMVRCGECNENGIIQCPLCCSTNSHMKLPHREKISITDITRKKDGFT